MGKVVNRKPNTMEGEGEPIYDKQRELYPQIGMPASPQIGSREAEFINYNWALARTIGYVRDRKFNRSELYDVLLKARLLFDLGYKSYYGKPPVLPELRPVNQ